MTRALDTFVVLGLSALVFYVAGLTTLVGAWYLETPPSSPKPPPLEAPPPPRETVVAFRF